MKFRYTTPNTFTAAGSILYYGVLVLALSLFLLRNNTGLWQIIPIPHGIEIGGHLSNALLGLMYLWGVGAMNLLTKPSWGFILVNAGALIILNIVVESFANPLNTPDMTDAAYGITGIILTLGLLWLMQRCGIKKRSVSNRDIA